MEIASVNAKELNAIAAKLAAAIERGKQVSVDVVPKGWFTANEIAKKMGLHSTTISMWMRKLKAEKRKFRIKANLRVQAVPHYRL